MTKTELLEKFGFIIGHGNDCDGQYMAKFYLVPFETIEDKLQQLKEDSEGENYEIVSYDIAKDFFEDQQHLITWHNNSFDVHLEFELSNIRRKSKK